MDELMEAIGLREVFALVKYLDKLGYDTKKIKLGTLKEVNEDIKLYLDTLVHEPKDWLN